MRNTNAPSNSLFVTLRLRRNNNDHYDITLQVIICANIMTKTNQAWLSISNLPLKKNRFLIRAWETWLWHDNTNNVIPIMTIYFIMHHNQLYRIRSAIGRWLVVTWTEDNGRHWFSVQSQIGWRHCLIIIHLLSTIIMRQCQSLYKRF